VPGTLQLVPSRESHEEVPVRVQNVQAWELAGSQDARVTARSATRMRVFLFMGVDLLFW
jgi:hypothetical protein